MSMRTNEHFVDWRRGDKSPFTPTFANGDGRCFPVSVKVLKKCFGEPTGRKIAEAVL